MTIIMGYKFDFNGNTANNVDWSTSNITPYGKNNVDKIVDTTTTQKEITSIPSPFARIELVKEAFGKVVPGAIANYKDGQLLNLLHGNTIYNKMVSDTLDVAQIFFNYPSMKNKVDILVWNRRNCISALSNSNDNAHKIVGKTLDMFLKQDAQGIDPYNFGIMNDIYILKYKGNGHRQVHIIGATSPATLFFSTANDESGISRQFCFSAINGPDYAFDDKYASLDQRDPEFIKYLFTFKYSDPNFSTRYTELNKYLDAVYTVLSNGLKRDIDAIADNINGGNAGYIDNEYDKIQFSANNQTYNVEVNGAPLHCKKIQIVGNTDFEINTAKQINGNKPLVLPITQGTPYSNLRYDGGIFGIGHNVPYYDAIPLNNRRLPGIGVAYPYLTISDFLDDKIIRLPAPINSVDYFDGNISGNSKYGYLLPILPTYFDYFSADTLMGKTQAGNNVIEIKDLAAGAVEVTLRIPIQQNIDVVYKRIYTPGVIADKSKNQGAIVVASEEFTAGVFPSVKFANGADAHYRVALFDDFNLNKDSACEFHNEQNGFLNNVNWVVRNNNTSNDIRSKVYFIEGQSFDCVRITIKTNSNSSSREKQGTGLLIPKFKQPPFNTDLSFAIDLGTSNTHIEFTTGGQNNLPIPFTYDKQQPLMSLICDSSADTTLSHINAEFLPEAIGDNGLCHFPMRTVLCKDRTNSGINESGQGDYIAFGNASPAFMYNKSDVGSKYNDYIPNLKWNNDDLSQDHLRYYIESLLLMIRAKVLSLGGSLANTKIKWFYPVSMSAHKRSLFTQIWDTAYKKYFNQIGATTSTSESIAPYSYFQSMRGDVTNVVTVDIGGGTTDVVVADLNGAKLITSMRFAADAIFGTSLLAVQDGPLNGIVKQFKEHFVKRLQGLDDLIRMLDNKTMGGRGISSEVASFYFSLVDNEEVKKHNIQNKVNFNTLLQKDTTQKIVFYIFYTAIMYHTARLMKARGFDAPTNIAFSGNGSKILSILSPDNKILGKLASNIFNLIYIDVDIQQINIITNDQNPKEVTCKGGLLMTQAPQNEDGIKCVLLGSDTTTLVSVQRYSEIETLYEDVKNEVKNFMDFITIKLPKRISLNNELGINDDSIDLAVSCFNKDLKAFIENGVKLKLKSDVSSNDIIEESLFFYPIIGVMNDISEKVYQQQINNNR